jgi:signal transduction histidine kinase
MGASVVILAAAGSAAGLALAAAGWALGRRGGAGVTAPLPDPRETLDARAAMEAFDGAVLALEAGGPRLVGGEEALAACADLCGCDPDPAAVLAALGPLAPALHALQSSGAPFDAQVRLGAAAIEAAGRAAGALAWVRLRPRRAEAGPDVSGLLAQALDAQAEPVWLTRAVGPLVWANAAWLKAVEAPSLDAARERGLAFDAGAEALAREAAAAGQPREALRWITAAGARRAFQVSARPLPGGLAAASALDVTEAQEAREALRRHLEAQGETLDHIGEAVAIFSPARALLFHNTAFAALWGLEPAWLAEGPAHGEILDRLRQRRRLPETADYGGWKAAELGHYEALDAAAEEIWPLPDGRTLRVVRQLHPQGGLLLLFSDITDELRLRAQYNALIQVQRATLDKLSDAVAVFGSDGRLRLHNEAFAALWGATGDQLDAAGDFDGVVELCVRQVHDMHLWRDLKARVTDTDPEARAPLTGEVRAADRRILAYQSRPLPDGATLLAFADISDTRALEGALADREAALEDAERLKRDFVANVSYELRTPMTTIIGYAELLEQMGETLNARARGPVAAVRAAAAQLGRSIGDVLDMAQIDAGDIALSLGEVPVEGLLAGVAGRWSAAADGAGARIVIACPDDIGAIRADAARLGQVLDHLVENAVLQSPPGGTVTLSARRAFGEIQLQVSDQGRGIPFHVQAHIFDRFVGRDRGGPGLGLALVKALVELHGGWVALDSAPGAGAAFTCHLPEEAQG